MQLFLSSGNKSLGKVPDLVIMVSTEIKSIHHPVEKRYLGIGIVTTNHQYYCVNQDEPVGEAC